MNKIQPKHFRVLGIALSTRGFGFAVLEGNDTLVDWGVKTVQGNKNANSVAKVDELIAHYQPGVLVLEDTEGSRRSARIQALSRQIVTMAATRKVSMKLFSQEEVQRIFFADGKGTKHAVAEIIAKRFPEEPWMSEHYQMDIFDAVALVLVLRLKQVSDPDFRTKYASCI